MIKVIVHSNYDVLNKNNNIFNNVGDVSVKDFLNQMFLLGDYGRRNGVEFVSSDSIDLSDADSFLFIDMPDLDNPYYQKAVSTGKSLFLLVWESGIINPRNSDKRLHDDFKGVFTYDDTLIDDRKYFKVAYSFCFPEAIPKVFESKKLCCLIAGNKSSTHPLELYSKRLDAIAWFEANQPDQFDFYGQGWTKIIPPRNILHRAINKYPLLNKYLSVKHACYRGEIVDKLEIYRKYLFSICFENARDLSGYISEKIFDCFFAGCVPVYWGATNISDYVPPDCFIDMRRFRDVSELHNHLVSINENEYFDYLCAIEDFIKANKRGVFSVDYFSEKITGTICKYY